MHKSGASATSIVSKNGVLGHSHNWNLRFRRLIRKRRIFRWRFADTFVASVIKYAKRRIYYVSVETKESLSGDTHIHAHARRLTLMLRGTYRCSILLTSFREFARRSRTATRLRRIIEIPRAIAVRMLIYISGRSRT